MINNDFQAENRARSQLEGGRLLRLAAQCPSCGAIPAIRITQSAREGLGHYSADDRIATYQCRNRRCGEIYDLRASAFWGAA